MDSKSITYHIGELAQSLGVSARSIRYYEEMGLLSPSRTEGGFRLYTDHDREVIKLILRFKDLGMALEEIRTLVAPRHEPLLDHTLEEIKRALLARRSEFEQKIAKLKQSVDQIDDVIGQLTRCEVCGKRGEKKVCDQCLGDRGGMMSPLLDPLR